MKFAIYQLDSTNETVEKNHLLFGSWFKISQAIKEHSLSLYTKVYEGEKPDDETFGKTITSILENIFIEFNCGNKLENKGHSLSVSDIVYLEEPPRGNYYLCDSHGWVKLKNTDKPGNVTGVKTT